MDKKYLLLALVVVAGAVGFYKYKSRCIAATPNDYEQSLVHCAEKIYENMDKVRDDICVSLKREKQCSFSEGDLPSIQAALKQKLKECSTKNLEGQGMCTDHLDRFLDQLF